MTAESVRKSRQAIRRLQKLEPDALVAVCGCFSQLSPDDAAALGADLVAGSADRHGFANALEQALGGQASAIEIDDPFSRRAFEPLPSGSVSGRTRAMLKIQDGCRNFCAYCIIPYARGRVRSLPLDAIRAEASALQAQGFKEIVATGIEIASYGADLDGAPGLIDAIRAVSESAPDVRIRLGSLEPRAVTREFCAALQSFGNICAHFHLSLQSGCDATLERMNRRYTTARFDTSVAALRDAFPGCGLTADLIVGFPGETDEEFSQTLAFIRKCAFSSMHIFPYSIRPGTPAATMPDQLDKAVKKARARQAGLVAEEMEHLFAKGCVGTIQRVLFETESDGFSTGRAQNYVQVRVRGTGLRGTVQTVRITSADACVLIGEIVAS